MPLLRKPLPFERVYLAASNNALLQSIPGLAVTAAQLGGFYTEAFRVPLDMARSRPTRLWLPIYNPGAAGPAAGDVQIEATITDVADAGTAVNTTLTNLVTIAATWPSSECRFVEILNGADPAFGGGFFQPERLYAIRFSRNGPAAPDTWAATLGLVTAPWIEYSENCLRSCL